MWNGTEDKIKVKITWIRHGMTQANGEHRYLGKRVLVRTCLELDYWMFIRIPEWMSGMRSLCGRKRLHKSFNSGLKSGTKYGCGR